MNTPYPGGLAAAIRFWEEELAPAAGTLADSSITVNSPNKIGIVAPNIDDQQMDLTPEIFDPARNGTGTPGNDTRSDANVFVWTTVPSTDGPGGSSFTSAYSVMMAFNAAGGGMNGVLAAQAVVNASPVIPPTN
jgi:hypothetical protein